MSFVRIVRCQLSIASAHGCHVASNAVSMNAHVLDRGRSLTMHGMIMADVMGLEAFSADHVKDTRVLVTSQQ